MTNNFIIVRGARQHNLKNINIDIPKNKLVVVTGVSGSGKSTLAFDTLYAEGQRRYVESLSAYARQFLELMEKPDVDLIDFLSPAISIEQKSISKNPRSTVGTITEIHDYLRLLYARVGDIHCPSCGKLIQNYTVQQIVDSVMSLPEETKIEILSPVVRSKKGEYRNMFKELLKNGYVRAYVNNTLLRLEDEITLDKNIKHEISVVIDRIKIRSEVVRRITDSIEVALKLSDGLVIIKTENEEKLYSEKFACLECNISFEEVEPRIFSFNNPYGACPKCDGLGVKLVFDIDAIIPDKNVSIREGAIKPWSHFDNFHFYNTLMAVSEKYKIDINAPVKDIPKEKLDIFMNGTDEKLDLYTFSGDKKIHYKKEFEGIIGYLKHKLSSEKFTDMEYAKSFMSEMDCEMCNGTRLKPSSLSVKIGGLNIAEVSRMNVSAALEFIENLTFQGFKKEVADKITKEIKRRLNFLIDVGLDYITLDRRSSTLSGGESQRIRLATQVGSGLTGVLYVLDEPSIGLHQRDNERLIETLKGLRDIGNTLIVVEHDEDTIMQADFIIDMGPGAGRKGGEIVYSGSVRGLKSAKNSLTADYMFKRKMIEFSSDRRKPSKFLEISGVKQNNLKNITVRVPLEVITCVTGVSGSGKSTLVMDVLFHALKRKLGESSSRPGIYKSIRGYDYLDKIIDIDQSPIGRTPRSNPATYTAVFNDIRDIFAILPDSKIRGYKPGRFSFNLKGGRCEHCQGEGFIKIEMHFLPDMYVKCDVCGGKRYNRDTLDIKYKGKNIAEVLDMTVNQSYEFFENVPKLKSKLGVLKDVGLGYIKLGQAATTLSGGEAQRIKLSKELMKRATGKTLYIFDEPTTGLHFDDVNKLIGIFNRLVSTSNSIIIIEHNLDVIKCADYIIDLGPEGGHKGGEVIFAGTPEECAKCSGSYTGKFLKEKIDS